MVFRGWRAGRGFDGCGTRLGARLPRSSRRLLACSGILLVACVGAYAASIPSLLSSPRVARTAAGAISVTWGDGEKAPQGSPGSPEDGEAAGSASTPAAGSATSDLAGLVSTALKGAETLTASPSPSVAPSGQGTSGGASGSGADTGSGSGSDAGQGGGTGSGGGSTSGGGDSQDGGKGDDGSASKPDPEQERRAHQYLVDKAAGLSGWLSQVDARVADFNNDQLATFATRQQHLAEATVLRDELYGEALAIYNSPLITNESAYRKPQGSLIGMHRCLSNYMDVLCAAWTVNLQYDDAAVGQHVDEYMDPIRSTQDASGRNTYLVEYDRWAKELQL